MKRKVKGRVHCKFVGTFAVLMLACTWQKASADLVPIKILLAYAPDVTYERELQLEDRRHNLELLKFRTQRRAVEAKFSQDMIDCANKPADDDCPHRVAAEETRGFTAIQKQEINENKRHLDNLDKLATFYAFEKRR